MRKSALYKQLELRLDELRKNLLPKRFSTTGNYSIQQLDQARGYKLLAHAEIEFYLEEIVKDSIIHALTIYKTTNKPMYSLFSLLASYHSSFNVDGDDAKNEMIIKYARARRKVKESISEIIHAAQSEFSSIIKENHGIKEKNLKSLLIPIGIEIDEIDNTWLADMETYGSERGVIAHSNISIHSPINPKDEYKKIISIKDGLKKLDIKISELKTRA